MFRNKYLVLNFRTFWVFLTDLEQKNQCYVTFRHRNSQNLLKTDLTVSDNVQMLNFMPKEYEFLEFAKQTKKMSIL
jgi:hypothetical protein